MDSFKARVNGETIKESAGKHVVLVCKIVSNDGASAQAQASDGIIVGLSPNGYITEAGLSWIGLTISRTHPGVVKVRGNRRHSRTGRQCERYQLHESRRGLWYLIRDVF